MKENKILSIYIIILSLSIVVGSVWIGNSIRDVNQSLCSQTNNKALMTENETAEYLNLSLDKFKSLLSCEELQREGLQGYATYRFLNFIQIDDVKYFNKELVDKWVEYNVVRCTEINTDGNK